MNNRKIGDAGEDLACRYLEKQGYEIIAKYKNTTVFVEVKTRKNDNYGTPFEAITKTKYENIKTGVYNYLQEHTVKDYRIDVIGITLKPELKIEHQKNV